MRRPPRSGHSTARNRFDVEAHLETIGAGRQIAIYQPGDVVFSQGDPSRDVYYLHSGAISLSVLSPLGKEAVVTLLVTSDFLGEGALAGQPVRLGTATATIASRVLIIDKHVMVQLLHDDSTFSGRFIAHMLSRNIRIEANLVDQLFNSCEKRLARTLLLLARYGEADPQRTPPNISQETLANMVGTTRSRVNVFMNKFKMLGYVDYKGGLKINPSLLSVVLRD